MRLTLRTMLAYLDGILEPEDAQDIGKKIEDSQYATSLMHRIRDVMRRLRLTAPSVSERGPGLDANTVADYLDNTLPADRVPDFEKVCLDSDVHLAEVAACHQVLAVVLGEPAEIDPESRQRMYQLPRAAAQATAANRGDEAAGAAGEAKAEPPAYPPRPKPTVPEYLREPPKARRFLTTVTLLVLVGCFGGLVLLVTGQLEKGTPIGNLLRTGRWRAPMAVATKETEQEKAAVATDRAKGEKPSASDHGKEAAPAAPVRQQPPAAPPIAAPTEEKATSGTATGVAAKPPAAGESGTATGGTATGGTVETAPLPPGAVQPPLPGATAGTPAAGASAPLPPGGPTTTPSPPVGPEAIARIAPKALPAPGEKTPQTEAKLPPAGEANTPSPPAPLVPPQQVARYNSEDEVLLSFDAHSGAWQRVPEKEMLFAGQRLLVLPTYRDEIGLASGVTVQMVGPTQVELLPHGAEGPPGLEIAFGRLVLTPLAQAGSQVQLTAGDRSGVLTLVDAESIATLEATRRHVPGGDPEDEKSTRVAANLCVAHGAIRWQEKGRERIRVTAPARLVLEEKSPLEAVPLENRDLPKWIVVEPLPPLERRASTTIAQSQSLQPGRPAELGLMELADHRQKEVSWLARRCLGYLGQFDTMVKVLNDPAHRLEWPDYIEQLRDAIARGRETAAAVRAAMEKQFSPEGGVADRMLWGYTDKQLQNGQDAKLVDLLEHEALAFRVLSFWNLRDITGWGMYYQPELPSAKRQQAVTRWKRRCEAGEIRVRKGQDESHDAAEPPMPP